MCLILCWSYLNHSLRFVGVKKRGKKKSHIKSQSQYFGKKSQLDYFPKSFSPTGDSMYDVQLEVLQQDGAHQGRTLIQKKEMATLRNDLVPCDVVVVPPSISFVSWSCVS